MLAAVSLVLVAITTEDPAAHRSVAAALQLPPSVYWVATPVLAGDTILIAGAGLGNASISISGPGFGATAAAAANPADVWAQSVKVVLPAGCGPPCNLTIETAGRSSRTVVAVNAPQLEWLGNAGRVTRGEAATLRVFGRGMAWKLETGSSGAGGAGAWRCAGGRTRQPADSTTLRFGTQPAVVIAAQLATCYEASFAIPAAATLQLPLGIHTATLATPWGTAAVTLDLRSAAARQLLNLDVDRDFGGDVHAALRGAAAGTAAGGGGVASAAVHLGPRLYRLTRPISLPNQTVLRGAGAAASTLLFELAGPAGQDFSHNYSQAAAVAALGVGSAIRDLAVVLRSPPFFPTAAVWMAPSARNFSVAGLSITLEGNVSNALRADGDGFELGNTAIRQRGSCPAAMRYGPGGQVFGGARFQQRVLLYLHAATNVWIHDNNISWQCGGWMDGDVSDRVVVEDNHVVCSSAGTNRTTGIDGGNSISAYDVTAKPSSAFWSVARNTFARPPRNGEDALPQRPDPNWVNHETLTTDAPGEFAHGKFLSQHGLVVSVNWTYVRPWVKVSPGASVVVLSGPGVGQHRTVMSFDNSTGAGLVTVDRAFDGYLAAASQPGLQHGPDSDSVIVPSFSVIAVVPRIGAKNWVGNSFNWTGVIQFYGTTLGGTIADNDLRSVNVHTVYDSVNGASLKAEGLCYYGAQPSFFLEILNNTLVDSDGVGFFNEAQSSYQGMVSMCNIDYAASVPWVRWGVARHNSISGISDAARYRNATVPACGGVRVISDRVALSPELWPTDIVTEHNSLGCPPPGVLPGVNGTVVIGGCNHCAIAPH